MTSHISLFPIYDRSRLLLLSICFPAFKTDAIRDRALRFASTEKVDERLHGTASTRGDWWWRDGGGRWRRGERSVWCVWGCGFWLWVLGMLRRIRQVVSLRVRRSKPFPGSAHEVVPVPNMLPSPGIFVLSHLDSVAVSSLLVLRIGKRKSTVTSAMSAADLEWWVIILHSFRIMMHGRN